VTSASRAERAPSPNFGAQIVTTKPVDPLAQIEHAQAIIADGDAPLAQLEKGRLDLQRVIGSAEADLLEIGSRRKIELLAHAPAGELNRKLEALEKSEKEAQRRVQIANAILSEVETRIDAAREAESAAKRRADYEAVLDRRGAFVRRAEELLGRVGPELRDLIAEYNSVELAISAVNRSLPFGADRIPSTEAARMGALPAPRITERRFQGFVHQGQLVGEMGRCEAFPHQGHWVVYKRSNAIQGDLTIGPCTLVDYIESTVEKYEAPRLEALASALRVPAFDAPAPKLGRPERRVTPAAQAPLQMAAE
jgi:hypothetical protein